MSNPLRVTNNRNEIHVETLNRTCLSNFIQRIRNFCNCFGSKNEENEIPLVHAVDSVRLVYMRRIEEASLLNLRRQNLPEEQSVNEIQPRIIRHRRMKQEQSTLEALEKALKEYESKNKIIISSTRVPNSISFNKSCKISRSCQTDKPEMLSEILQPSEEMKMKDSFSGSEEIENIILNNSNDKCTNTDNRTSNLENIFIEAVVANKECPVKIVTNVNLQ